MKQHQVVEWEMFQVTSFKYILLINIHLLDWNLTSLAVLLFLNRWILVFGWVWLGWVEMKWQMPRLAFPIMPISQSHRTPIYTHHICLRLTVRINPLILNLKNTLFVDLSLMRSEVAGCWLHWPDCVFGNGWKSKKIKLRKKIWLKITIHGCCIWSIFSILKLHANCVYKYQVVSYRTDPARERREQM